MNEFDSEEPEFVRFKELFYEAQVLRDNGNARESADKFVEAVLAAPSVWSANRFVAFQSYLSAIVNSSRTKEDIKLLKQSFLHNNEEPALYRASAALVVGMEKLVQDRSVHQSAEYFRLGLDIVKKSPREHDELLVILPPFGSGETDVTVKSEMLQLKTMLELNVSLAEGNQLPQREFDLIARAGLTREYSELVGRRPMVGEEEDLFKRSLAGGKHCDVCNKSEEEMDEEELSKCSRCKLAFYCSSNCQKKAWYAGHREACRKRGQIEVGDDMVLDNLSNRTDLNGCFVKVVRKNTASEGRWIVQLLSDSTAPMSVSGNNMLRLRPKA